MRIHRMPPATIVVGVLAAVTLAHAADEPAVPHPGARRAGPAKACYPAYARKQHLEGRVTVTVTVAPDGTVTDVQIPSGTPGWISEAARCVVAQMSFKPGRLNGIPIEAQVAVPINFGLTDSLGQKPPHLESPVLRSTQAELEAAYHACYPAALKSKVEIAYRIEIAITGRVRRTEVLESSDDRRLDKAGACVLKRLNFTPAMRASQAVKSTVTWSLLVRPPASE